MIHYIALVARFLFFHAMSVMSTAILTAALMDMLSPRDLNPINMGFEFGLILTPILLIPSAIGWGNGSGAHGT
ncbi:MAG: hypothetical protein ACK5LJ_11120 [Paracoccus sp. (in: a-proteobacteria)]